MNHVCKISLFFLAGFLSIQGSAQNISAKADSLARVILKQKNVPGLLIGIVSDGNTQVFSYGETAKGNGIRPDTSHVYEIGSLTQVFTTTLYSGMVIDTLVKSDDPLQMYLPAGIKVPVRQNIVCKPVADINRDNPDRREIHITPYTCFPDPASRPLDILLCDLATHNSGLPEKPENLEKGSANIYAGYELGQLYHWLNEAPLIAEQYPDYHFSDAGMALLGQALVQKSGRSYDELLQRRLLDKLHMHGTKTEPLKSEWAKHLDGYNSKGEFVPSWKSEAMAPAVGLHTTMSDMLLFMKANLGETGKTVMPAIEYTHAPRTQVVQQKKTVEEIGLGWRIKMMDAGKYRITWQEGKTAGFSAYMGFNEIARTGVVILCNSPVNLSGAGEELLKALQKTVQE
ncbi:MAG: beta-lactamase [Bacteroidetes bacterium]|nr:MAG: beta-lactamase [Bacteroidota bacterium]